MVITHSITSYWPTHAFTKVRAITKSSLLEALGNLRSPPGKPHHTDPRSGRVTVPCAPPLQAVGKARPKNPRGDLTDPSIAVHLREQEQYTEIFWKKNNKCRAGSVHCVILDRFPRHKWIKQINKNSGRIETSMLYAYCTTVNNSLTVKSYI